MAFAQHVMKNGSVEVFSSLARLSPGEEDGRAETIGGHMIF